MTLPFHELGNGERLAVDDIDELYLIHDGRFCRLDVREAKQITVIDGVPHFRPPNDHVGNWVALDVTLVPLP